MWESIAAQIAEATGASFNARDRHALGGGCINSAYRVGDGERTFFVKLNSADKHAMFAAEADGLAELARAQALVVPEPICHGVAGGQAFIVLQALSLGGNGSPAEFGRQLAQLHRTTAERFGWWRDNTIGSTHQPNRQHHDWVAFWRHERLGFQLELAGRNGMLGLEREAQRLLAGLDGFFSDYRPIPSLLHGDLWGGNFGYLDSGAPCIYDPAVYYGDREAELAMTELFGGFGSAFYAAYDEAWPRDVGYDVRRTLYNLYHILNHANMFGGGYAGQASAMIGRLTAELG